MTNVFDRALFSFERVSNSVIGTRKKTADKESMKIKPVDIGVPPYEAFCTKLAASLVKAAMLPEAEQPQFIVDFSAWLVIPVAPVPIVPEIVLSEGVEEPPVAVVIEGGIPEIGKPAVVVEPVTLEKPTEIPAENIKNRYKQLQVAKVEESVALTIMANEFNIPANILKGVIEDITPLAETLGTVNDVPDANAQQQQAVIAAPPGGLPPEVQQDIAGMTESQRNNLTKLAEMFGTSEVTLITELIKQAEQSPIPMHWLNKFLQHCIQKELVALAGDRVIHSLMVDTDSVIEMLIDPKIEITIDNCYNIGELSKLVRCVARTIGTRRKDLYADSVPFYANVTEVPEIGTLSRAFDVMKGSRQTLSVILEILKREGETMTAVSGTIMEARNPKEGLWYLNLHDGSPLPPRVAFSIEIGNLDTFEKITGISEADLKRSEQMSCLVYGYMKYLPASPAFSVDAAKIVPEYMILG